MTNKELMEIGKWRLERRKLFEILGENCFSKERNVFSIRYRRETLNKILAAMKPVRKINHENVRPEKSTTKMLGQKNQPRK
jgi:hypothetical protein